MSADMVQIQNEAKKIIAYASRTYDKSTKNCITAKRECLAVNNFQPYQFERYFICIIDYYSLYWVMILKDPQESLLNKDFNFRNRIFFLNV